MLLISENYRYFLIKKILAIRLWNNCCISNAYICISLHGILTTCDRLYVVLKQQKLNQKFVLSVQWHAVTLSSVYSKIKNGNIALGVSTQKTFRLCRFIVNYHPVTKEFLLHELDIALAYLAQSLLFHSLIIYMQYCLFRFISCKVAIITENIS